MSSRPVPLRRTLGLPLVVLYGLGVTIGAGIYVLIGETVAVAGAYAPLAFIVAAAVMLPSACSFAELVGRFPVSAGEAAYVRNGLRSEHLATIIGLMVISVGSISAAAICVGSVGYIRQFLDLPSGVLIPIVVASMTGIAMLGVRESVTFAGTMTLVEVIGLLVIVVAGLAVEGSSGGAQAPLQVPALSAELVFTVLSGGVIAFFAFVGFEDMVNMAEETTEPRRTMPRAIFITLFISTLLYVLVAIVAIKHVAVNDLASSEAPLSLVFERTINASPALINAIAIVATLNGVIVQIIMASRVIHGLSNQASLPSWMGRINARTQTPLRATLLVGMVIVVLATLVPLRGLAAATSLVTLSIFAIVNISLLAIKWRREPPPAGIFYAPFWVPVLGLICSCALIIVGLVD